MVVLVAHTNFKPESVDAALAACRQVRSLSVQEPGCAQYDFYQSPDDPAHVVFVEEWTTRELLQEHFAAESFMQFQAAIGDLLAGVPTIRIYTIRGHEDL